MSEGRAGAESTLRPEPRSSTCDDGASIAGFPTAVDWIATAHPPSWEELVSAAVLGAERRPPPGGSVPALLDAAALHTVRRRAGARPAAARQLPEPAPAEPRPRPPEPAVRRLTALLAARHHPPAGPGRRGASPDLAELLPQWLAVALAAGYAAPAEELPSLLETARGRTDLRPQILALAGARGRWLARLNPQWRFALRGAAPPSAHHTPASTDAATSAVADRPAGSGSVGVSAEEQQLWQEGLFAERVDLLARVRARDPGAGRELLASIWHTERAEDRLLFLDTLRTGLALADEEFLERALADGGHTVRSTAAELLAALPESAYSARMAARAHRCLRLVPPNAPAPAPSAGARPSTPAGAGSCPPSPDEEHRLVVTPPDTCDDALRRDGVLPTPPPERSASAWWLGQLLAAAPLGVWGARWAGRTPEEIVALPVAEGWRTEVHGAWCRAAVRQQDVAWARALLGAPGEPSPEGAADPPRLLAMLPAPERAAWAAEFVAHRGLSDAFRVLAVCAVPWSVELGAAVVDALEIASEQGRYPWSHSSVLGLAERCLDPQIAGRLTPLAALPDESEHAAPGAGAYWADAFQRLVATLHLRAEILDELQPAS